MAMVAKNKTNGYIFIIPTTIMLDTFMLDTPP